MPGIQWAFFDTGDVVFDETPPHRLLFHTCLQVLRQHGKTVTWDEYNAKRIDIVRTTRESLSPTIQQAMASFCDGKEEADALWKEAYEGIYGRIRAPRRYGVLADGFQPMLERLKGTVRMAVLANQHPECLDALKNYGLDAVFDLMLISEIEGLSKPDPAFFRLGLERAGCAPAESVYVGDRVDHDIAPAKAIGMRTIHYRYGCHYTLADPRAEAEIADEMVDDLPGLERAIRGMAAG